MRMAVVLPAPLGPSRTVILFSGTVRSRPARASTLPKRRRTPDSSTTGFAPDGSFEVVCGGMPSPHRQFGPTSKRSRARSRDVGTDSVQILCPPVQTRDAGSAAAGDRPDRVVQVFVLGIDPGLSRCGYGAVRATAKGPR